MKYLIFAVVLFASISVSAQGHPAWIKTVPAHPSADYQQGFCTGFNAAALISSQNNNSRADEIEKLVNETPVPSGIIGEVVAANHKTMESIAESFRGIVPFDLAGQHIQLYRPDLPKVISINCGKNP